MLESKRGEIRNMREVSDVTLVQKSPLRSSRDKLEDNIKVYLLEIFHEDMNSSFWNRKEKILCFPAIYCTDCHLLSTFTGKHRPKRVFHIVK
jgi:hypothetical protein